MGALPQAWNADGEEEQRDIAATMEEGRWRNVILDIKRLLLSWEHIDLYGPIWLAKP